MAATNAVMSASIASSVSSLKKLNSIPGSLQQSMVLELKVKESVQRSSQGQRVLIAGVRGMAPELVEMKPASEGSQLLGDEYD